MPAERYYYAGDLEPDASITLEGQELHHLLHVMRTQEGDEVEIVNGNGFLAQASVDSISKKQATLSIKSLHKEQPPNFKIIVAQAVPRGNRLDFILEKGTELGMTDIWLFPGKHSERKDISDNQSERMQSHLISAMKQCGNLYLPKIEIKPPLAKWTSLPFAGFYGDVNADAQPLIQSLNNNLPQGGLIFFIGPESGFNDEEITNLKKLGCQGVKLNKNILRTETAAIAAVALISQFILQKNN